MADKTSLTKGYRDDLRFDADAMILFAHYVICKDIKLANVEAAFFYEFGDFISKEKREVNNG